MFDANCIINDKATGKDALCLSFRQVCFVFWAVNTLCSVHVNAQKHCPCPRSQRFFLVYILCYWIYITPTHPCGYHTILLWVYMDSSEKIPWHEKIQIELNYKLRKVWHEYYTFFGFMIFPSAFEPKWHERSFSIQKHFECNFQSQTFTI